MRHDVVHFPSIGGDGVPVCSACGVRLPAEESVAALAMAGAVIDVGGFGGAFYPSDLESIGKEALRCTHPAAAAEVLQYALTRCECLGEDSGCEVCGGNGMVAEAIDPSDPEHPRRVRVESGGLSWEQLSAEGLRSVSIPAKTDDERMATRGAFQNWLGLREATRPEGTKSS